MKMNNVFITIEWTQPHIYMALKNTMRLITLSIAIVPKSVDVLIMQFHYL